MWLDRRWQVKHQIASMWKELNPEDDDGEPQLPKGDDQTKATGASQAAAPTKVTTEASKETVAKEPTWPADDVLDVCRLVRQLRELPGCREVPKPDTALRCLVARMNEMREPLRQFCEHEQLQEKTLSRAQISEVGSRQMTEWNEIQHQLALARQASQLGGGQRMSRLEVWRSQQQHLMDKSVHDSTAAACGPVTHFGSHSGPQVLLFLREDGTVGLGYCLSVYRGALISGTATRTLRVSRPSASPLPAGLIKSLRVLELVQSLEHTWIGTLLNPTHMIDPTSACGQIRASDVQQNANRLTVTFSSAALQQMQKYLDDEPWKEKVLPPPKASQVAAVEGLVAKNFTPVAGAKWIPIYLERLPKLYSELSMPILDKDGNFETTSHKMRWSEIVARTHGFFDVQLAGQSSHVYSNNVLGQLALLHPSKDGALKRLKHFAAQVDLHSAPWLPMF